MASPKVWLGLAFVAVALLMAGVESKVLARNMYQDQDETQLKLDNDLWARYRTALIKILKQKFPSMRAGPESNTILSLVTSPWEAEPHDFLSEVGKYPPLYSSTWDTRSGATMEKLYESMLMKCDDPMRFVQFRKVSHNWNYVGRTLQQFANQYSNGGHRIHFIVDEQATQTNIVTPWSRNTGPIVNTGFVKEVVEVKDDDDVFAKDLDTDSDRFLFRRRRRRRSPPPQVKTIIVKSSKFKVDFKANGLEGIKIHPGQWFDKNFLKSQRGKLAAEFFGRSGKFPVLPVVAWMAMKPKARVEISESEWHRYEYISRQTSTLGFAIGGTFFRTRNFKRHVKDDDTGRYSAETKAFYENEDLAAQHADNIVFRVEKRRVRDDDQSSETAAAAAAAAAADDSLEVNDIFDGQDMDRDADRFFRRRRRRRRRYVPPPPPKKVYENVYIAEFSSSRLTPEVLAVTSEIL